MTPRVVGVALALSLLLAGCTAPDAGPASPDSPATTGDTPTTGSPATTGDTPTTPAGTATTADGTATADSGPTTGRDDDQSPTPTAEPEIAVTNGSLPVDAGGVFAGVREVLAVDAAPPERVRVVDDPSALAAGGNVTAGSVPPFWRLVGVRPAGGLNDSELDGLENGVTTGLGTIAVYPGRQPTAERVRWVLAHEYVHYVAVRRGWGAALSRNVDARTTDGAYVARSVGEGAAVVATDAYLRARGSDRTNAAVYRRLAERLPAGSPTAYTNGAYVAGSRYVESRIDDPADLPSVFERPPRTSEQVLHGRQPGAEPPADLSVEAGAAGPWRPAGTDRMGEAFVRAALANGVEESRAARAAAGWGDDELRAFRSSDGEAGYAWLLRWDDDANASEFERALRDSLDARGDRVEDDDRWRVAGVRAGVRSPDDRTVVLVMGPEAFVESASVRADDGDYVVRVGPGG